jgi:pimeloyl-ACP methyl ester carboxylesterase
LQALLPKLVQSATDCAKQPAGVENDYALLFGEPWLQPGSVHCPTLILHDLADPVARLPHVEWAMNCIPHAELCDLHAGGHLIWFGHDAARMQRRRAAFICKFAV